MTYLHVPARLDALLFIRSAIWLQRPDNGDMTVFVTRGDAHGWLANVGKCRNESEALAVAFVSMKRAFLWTAYLAMVTKVTL